jgi:hypothetical protein
LPLEENYGMQRGEEVTCDLEPGKTLIVKFLARR